MKSIKVSEHVYDLLQEQLERGDSISRVIERLLAYKKMVTQLKETLEYVTAAGGPPLETGESPKRGGQKGDPTSG